MPHILIFDMMAARSSAYYQIHFAQSFNNLILLRSYLAYLTELVLAVQLGVATVLEKLQGCAVCVQPQHVVSLMLVWEQPLGVLVLYTRVERGGNGMGEGDWSVRVG